MPGLLPLLPDGASVERDRLLDEALALPRAERTRFLAAQSDAHPAVVAHVAHALGEVDRDDPFLRPGGALASPLFEPLWHAEPATSPGPTLAPGTRVGPYEVLGLLGAGGMGEVYRARDPRLRRDVALKVLPRHVNLVPGRAARLRREARVLAALSHPHVAAVYDLEESDDLLALVMEVVEGETLAGRLSRGVPDMAAAFVIARQVAEGLAAAHDRGIVHCDLKPGNVAFDRDGRVRLLDFGIATAARGDGEAVDPYASAVHAAPLVQGIAGTVRYMSPEQLRGEPVDPRTDVWAFGCLCFELVSGAFAFDATSTAGIAACVLEREFDLDRLPRATPAAWRTLIARCLEKDPAHRLPTIRDAIPLIDRAAEQHVHVTDPRRPSPVADVASLVRLRTAPVILGLVLGGAVALGTVWFATPVRRSPPVARLAVPVPAGDDLVTEGLPSIALTPDGATLVYRARRDGTLQLFRRTLDQDEPVVIPGSADAAGPFVSPDGAWVGFSRDGHLLRAPLAGGPLVTICACGGGGASASWGDRNTVVFAPTPGDGLYRVPAGGGVATRLTHVDRARGERAHGFPDVLPGERAALFSIITADTSHVALVDIGSRTVTRLIEGRQPRYLPSGYLTWVRGSALWAAPFDAARGVLTGAPHAVLGKLDLTPAAHVAFDRDGSLLYVPAPDVVPPRRLVKEDPAGATVAARRQLVLVQHWTTELRAALGEAR